MNITLNPNIPQSATPDGLHETLKDIRKTGQESLTKALSQLETVNALGVSQGKDGVLQLAPPKGVMNVSDLALRIGLLQDALDQLMQQVSKNDITGRLNELNRENKEQLDKVKDQMKHVKEAADKKKESEKKSNIFTMIANWFKAIFDIISAVFTAIACVAYALTGNLVAAVGLFVAAAAMIASAAVNIVLALDSTVKAAGGEGFLNKEAIQTMNKVTEILGYVAMGAALISGLGAAYAGVAQGVKMVASKMGGLALNEGAKLGQQMMKFSLDASTKEALKTVMKAAGEGMMDMAKGLATKKTQAKVVEAALKNVDDVLATTARSSTRASGSSSHIANEAAQEALQNAAKELFKQKMLPMMLLNAQLGLANGIGGGARTIIEGAGGLVVANLQKDAAAERLKADQAEAQAKAIQAMIDQLKKMIEDLQKDLSDMMESSFQVISAIFNAAEESQSMVKDLLKTQTA